MFPKEWSRRISTFQSLICFLNPRREIWLSKKWVLSLLQQQQRQLSCGSWLQDWPSYSADTVPAKPWNSFQPLPQMLPTNCCLGEESLGHIPWHPLVPQICLIHLFTPHLQSGRNDCLPSCLLIFSFSPFWYYTFKKKLTMHNPTNRVKNYVPLPWGWSSYINNLKLFCMDNLSVILIYSVNYIYVYTR